MSNIVEELNGLIPDLQDGRETHVQWRDADQIYLDANPNIGNREFHSNMVKEYDRRIATVLGAMSEIKQLRAERNAMAEYLKSICPNPECENGMKPNWTSSLGGWGDQDGWEPCDDPHHAKLRELGITENKDCHADAWGWERGEDQQ